MAIDRDTPVQIPNAATVIRELKSLASPEQARILARYFRTGPGEYGEGDKFFGITVPMLRSIARKSLRLPRVEIEKLLQSPWHESRHVALMILVLQAKKADDAFREEAFDFYLRNTRHVNNWDLVDGSAPQLVGAWLLNKSPAPLYRLAKSNSLWERRIAVIATQHFIRNERFDVTLEICRRLLDDQHDLIHKASGWMLRELGQKNQPLLEAFLEQHFAAMPRTMLRYSIERFSEPRRQFWIKRKPAPERKS